MIKIENVEVYNWEGCIRGMRMSWGSHAKSDSRWTSHSSWLGKDEYIIGPEDKKLMLKLSKAGGSHAKFLRQLLVSCDVTADTVWWAEADTYKVGTVANSTSTMHTMGRDGTISDAAFGFDNVDDPLVRRYLDEVIKQAVHEWVEAGGKRSSSSYEWRRMIQLNARAFLYTRHLTLNYQVLKSMYWDRKSHRYKEWHMFCEWIRTLPHSDLITLEEKQ